MNPLPPPPEMPGTFELYQTFLIFCTDCKNLLVVYKKNLFYGKNKQYFLLHTIWGRTLEECWGWGGKKYPVNTKRNQIDVKKTPANQMEWKKIVQAKNSQTPPPQHFSNGTSLSLMFTCSTNVINSAKIKSLLF